MIGRTLAANAGSVKSYEFGIDFDDGIDIDEAGQGDLRVVMVKSAVRGNLDEGVDLHEEGDGTAAVTFVGTEAENNKDDGIRVSESGAGDVDGSISDVIAMTNGGNGVRLEEADAGILRALVERSKTAQNKDGKDSGVRVTQVGDGVGTLTVRDSQLADGIDARNVTVIEK